MTRPRTVPVGPGHGAACGCAYPHRGGPSRLEGVLLDGGSLLPRAQYQDQRDRPSKAINEPSDPVLPGPSGRLTCSFVHPVGLGQPSCVIGY
jgi:hypothetical protein